MSVFGFRQFAFFLHNCGMLNLTSVYFVDANVSLPTTDGSLQYDMYYRCLLIKCLLYVS